VLVVEAQARFDVTTRLVRANPRSIVFTRTKYGASRLADDLRNVGVPAVDLHGDLSQRVRERNLDTFRTGRAHVVVATDVAARGIHVGGVGLVVHFDPAGEPKSYLHRSGRTARAGASGAVVTVATPGQARSMEGLHKRAGVDAKCVDPRSIDGPLTTTALAEAPAMAATARERGGAARSRRGALRGPDRGDGTRRDGDHRRGRRQPR
jgi:superfamily II DNA/RNA helicase